MHAFDAPSDEVMAKLREQHGDELAEVTDEETGRVFVLAKASNPRATLQRFQTLAANETKRLEALEGIAKASVVYPDKETIKRVLEDEPGLAFSLGEKALELLGLRKLAAKKG